MADAVKEETIARLCSLLEAAKSAGLSQDEISECLESEDLLSPPENDRKVLKKTCFILHCTVFKVLPVIFLLVPLYFPISAFLQGAPCLIPLPPPFRPPLMDCKFCKGVTEAPKLAANLSRLEFVQKYAYTSRPILVVGAASKWPAVDVFSYNYFKNLYLQLPDAIDDDTNSGQFFSYSSNIRDLNDLFQLSYERATMATEKWYIGW